MILMIELLMFLIKNEDSDFTIAVFKATKAVGVCA
jgi:hypothetical protein